MRHIYLINSDSRAAQYGIGTYIIQVINCLSSIDSLRLTVVSMNSEDGILTEKKDNNVRYLTFSKVYDWRSEKEIQRYYRSVAFLLALYVDSSEDNVFHFNYLHHEPLVDLLKKNISYQPICVDFTLFELVLHFEREYKEVTNRFG